MTGFEKSIFVDQKRMTTGEIGLNRIDHILICEANISAIIVAIAHVHVSWGATFVRI